jgi:2-methylcitrate dehydratase
MPEQYAPERLRRDDVQALLTRIDVRSNGSCSSRFPKEMPCRLNVRLRDGRILRIEKRDYEGFVSRPFNWQAAVQKFKRLTGAFCDSSASGEIAGAVANLEHVHIRDLVRALERIHEL